MKHKYVIPVFVSNSEYSNDSIFYNSKTTNKQENNITKKEAEKIIEEYLKSIKDDDAEIEIAFFGGSFTAIEEEKQNELLELAYQYIKENKVKSIRISTRPDYINKKILKRLKKYKVKTIELAVQTANDFILKKVGKEYTLEDIRKASKLIRKYRFTLGHQMMVGLPESTRKDEINTAKELIKLKPKMVRIYPVLIKKGTELEKEYEQERYKPLSIVQAVETCKELVRMFSDKKIDIIKVGFQDTDKIEYIKNKNNEIIAGPYHPAFRQLVESSLWYDSIVEKIKKLNVKVKEVEVTINPIDTNNVIGYKKENIKKLKQTYDVDLRINPDKKVKQGKSKIEITKTFE